MASPLKLSGSQIFQESLQLLEDLLKIPAYSGEEKSKADFLESFLLSKGFLPDRIGNNIYLSHKPDHSRQIAFHSHLDTVKAGESWTEKPFEGTWKDGKLIGLGSNDAGASVVAQLAAFRILVQSDFPLGLIWVAGAEEENSGKGGMELLINKLPELELAIVGEPTSGDVAIAEKGLMVVDGTVKGKSGHAARDEGENAIYKAMKDIEFFKEYRFDKVSETLGPVKMNLTVLHAGEKHNTVPDTCTYTVDIRLTDEYSHEEVLDILKKNCIAELKVRSTRLKPSATPKNHPIFRAIESLGLKTYGSPTLSDQALLNYPSIKLGPGDSARSHTADEFIYQEEIESLIRIYVELLQNLVKHDNTLE